MGDSPFDAVRVTRTSSDCGRGLHCFRPTSAMVAAGRAGACRACGAEPVAWHRIHQRKVGDLPYTFEALQLEMIRHFFWIVDLDPRALNYARRRGLEGLESAVPTRIRKSVGRAENPFDGRQTPREGSGNPIHYAQHATATCCRKCIEYWHQIPQGRALTAAEITYLSALVMGYLQRRLPDLKREGTSVPPIRNPKGSRGEARLCQKTRRPSP